MQRGWVAVHDDPSALLTQAVVVLPQPQGNPEDIQINSHALPRLSEQVLQAQSADIDGVSGATVTSDSYRQSLRSALSLVHIGGLWARGEQS